MKRIFLLATALLLIGLCAFAAGSREAVEEVEGMAPPMTRAVAHPGKVVFYATLAEYEKTTGMKIAEFNESPALAARVSAGEIPPVEQRISSEPMVMEPLNEIGEYGGKIRCSATAPTTGGGESWSARTQPIFRIAPGPEGDKVVANVAKGFDFANDYKELTIYFRKGMKWSDGADFSADDAMFWADDIIWNAELMPEVWSMWTPGGETIQVTKIDDTTIRMDFAASYPSLVDVLGYWNRHYHDIPFAPRHFLEQYHIEYNPDANKNAKDKGFEDWTQYFVSIYPDEVQQRLDPGVPTVDPWTMAEVDSLGNKYFERNPYYWKIDTAGNQLPYIDTQERLLFPNTEAISLAAISGDLDYAQQDLIADNFSLYKENEQKGGYTVTMWREGRGGSLVVFQPNFSYKEKPTRDILRDLRFRQALSLAINRDEINDVVFKGLAIPRQATIREDVSFYEDWMGQYYADCDPDRANKLLDEMGLKWDSDEEYRLRSDGEPVALLLEYIEMEGPRGRVLELVKEYWEDIGIKTSLKQVEGSLYWEHWGANELPVGVGHIPGGSTEIGFHTWTYKPAASEWAKWINSGGESGEEPPADVKRVYELSQDFGQALIGTDEYLQMGDELVTLALENMWQIGIIGMMPQPTIFRNGLENTPETGVRNYLGYRFWMIYNADQWYWQK